MIVVKQAHIENCLHIWSGTTTNESAIYMLASHNHSSLKPMSAASLAEADVRRNRRFHGDTADMSMGSQDC